MLQASSRQGKKTGPGPITGALARRWLAFRHRRLGRRYARLVIEEIDGIPIIVLPNVFNPVLLRSGAFMARSLSALLRTLEFAPQPLRVLDMGAGAGAGAIFAALNGAQQVTAVDINPDAVRCVQLNALLNNLEGQIKVCQGDLFAPVMGQNFDLVLFNPPFHRGAPRDKLDYAWRGLDVFERFAACLRPALSANGRALVLLSSDGDCDQMLAALQAQNFIVAPVAEKNLVNEILTIYSVRQPSGATWHHDNSL